MDSQTLIRLARRKKWEEIAAAINESPSLVRLQDTGIKRVGFYGDWNSMKGVFALMNQPSELSRFIQREEDWRDAAPVGFGLSIAPLHYRAASHSTECLTLLLDAGMDPNAVNANTPGSKRMFIGGQTPMYHALVNHNCKGAEILISYGADVHWTGWEGGHALHVTAAKSHVPETTWILEKGVDPNIQDQEGWTPLHKAARRTSSTRTLKLLVEAGADPSLLTHEGASAIDLALQHGKEKNVRYLKSFREKDGRANHLVIKE